MFQERVATKEMGGGSSCLGTDRQGFDHFAILERPCVDIATSRRAPLTAESLAQGFVDLRGWSTILVPHWTRK
jgi:hypothetical protein